MYFMIIVCFFGPLSVMSFSYRNILKFTKNLKRRIATARNIAVTPAHLSDPARAEGTDHNTIERSKKGKRRAANSNSKSQSSSPGFQVTPEETRITNTFIFVVTLFVIWIYQQS